MTVSGINTNCLTPISYLLYPTYKSFGFISRTRNFAQIFSIVLRHTLQFFLNVIRWNGFISYATCFHEIKHFTYIYTTVYCEAIPSNLLFVMLMRCQWNRKGCFSLSFSNFTQLPSLWINTIQQKFQKSFSYYIVHALSISDLFN